MINQKMEQLIKSESVNRINILDDEFNQFRNIEMLDISIYLSLLDARISNNIKQTYILPSDLWHLQQTNGYRSFKKGINFVTSNPY